jgi:hypothetical protein
VSYPQKAGCRVLNFSGLQDIWFTSVIEKRDTQIDLRTVEKDKSTNYGDLKTTGV